MITSKMPISIMCTFIWIGFVCAISFMEAWLKFKAPGITLPLGLGIGRIVFNALNKAEWVFACIILLNLTFSEKIRTRKNLLLSAPVLSLILQTVWLLPTLDARAQIHIDGSTPPHSGIHFYYIGLEVIKIIGLFIFGISLLKSIR